jgi:hypothetical protein
VTIIARERVMETYLVALVGRGSSTADLRAAVLLGVAPVD